MFSEARGVRIRIEGIVQGVGFRPFVHKLARELGLKGEVSNSADGVLIDLEGDAIGLFLDRVRDEAPALARITAVSVEPAAPQGYADFRIRQSEDRGLFTLLSPDVSVCGDCLSELMNPLDRRYCHPFINCTNCGPRYSITERVPYDRLNTTMKTFGMCESCRREYEEPADRRFHAQPIACPECGPSIRLVAQGEETGPDRALRKTIHMLKSGAIIALKGLGGFQLVCDARNADAVQRLRERKRRSNKPFALMAADVESAAAHCMVSDSERSMLSSAARPIVLLRKRPGSSLTGGIAPGNAWLGCMLPYTPLHHLLFFLPDVPGSEAPHFGLLVMTSGNLSEEPIITGNAEALEKLPGLADGFLLHDREIFMRVDDSVARVLASGDLAYLRRARGYVPSTVVCAEEAPDVLAAGADMKNTFALSKGRHLIVSQHIGDMEHHASHLFFEETLSNLKSVFRASPVAVACDLHPGYHSTAWARLSSGIGVVAGIQHHYAHIASVMAEAGITSKVVGVAFDGTGYGDDGTLWGGEFLVADLRGYRRAGHLAPIPLPGGQAAIREPWRIAVSLIHDIMGKETMSLLEKCGFLSRRTADEAEQMIRISRDRAFSPLSSGAGRVFDAMSSLLGFCDTNTFEGEASVALESAAAEGVADDLPCDIAFRDPIVVDFSHTAMRAALDLADGIDRRVIAARFHRTVAGAIVNTARSIAQGENLRTIVLSGGVFQNMLLEDLVTHTLRAEGFRVLSNRIVPCNDAGISLGQAYILRERLRQGWTL